MLREASAPDTPRAPSETMLPVPLAPLVGRAAELERAATLIANPAVRLITLTGPGGVGKTRLALAIAHARAASADVRFVPLATIRDPAHVLPAIGRALGLRGVDDLPVPERVGRVLRGRPLLLVLDNLEQVLGAAPDIAALLRASPGLTILATSRAPLRLTGEQVIDVPPLALPDPDAPLDAAAIRASEAVALFLARLSAARPGHDPTAAELPAIARICARLDGLPLALELAAARGRVLAPAELLAHLDHALDLLSDGPPDLPDRLRALRDAIAWSYALLTPAEQALFARLAVFAGGFTLDAAEAVAPDTFGSPIAVLDAIAALADQSLLRRVDGVAGPSRFEMLETIREFAAERLAASGDAPAARRAHAAWCRDLARRASAMYWGEAPGHWRALVEPEHANIRAALGWLLDHGETAAAVALALDLEPFWWLLGHGTEGRAWLERALATGDDLPGGLRARALVLIARVAELANDYAAAEARAEEAVTIARAGGDAAGVALALDMRAAIAIQQGQLHPAMPWIDAAIAHFRTAGDTGRLGWALCTRSVLVLFVAGPDDGPDRYRLDCQEALACFRSIGQRVGIARALHGLAFTEPHSELALARYREALGLLWAEGAWSGLASNLEGIAGIAHGRGHDETAARLFGIGAALREMCAVPRSAAFRAGHDGAVAAVRDRLGAEAFAAAWAAGHALPLEAALDLANQPLDPMPPALPDLTPRQREILERIAAGRTNRDIAAELYLSVRTVEDHVSNLLALLAVDSRAEAAARARAALPRA